jgi:hypothetical protein
MASQDYARACGLFERAAKLRGSIGILLNLGDCYDKVGRAASARATFGQAAYTAKQARDPREQYARQRMALLEPRVLRATIETWRVKGVRGVEVLFDGIEIPPSSWDRVVPVDPGQHTMSAHAPGKKAWSFSTEVTASTRIVVPALDTARAAIQPRQVVPSLAPEVRPSAPAPDARAQVAVASARLSPRRTWALVMAGGGVAGLGLGTALGLVSIAKHNEASSHCVAGENPCDGQGVSAGRSARTTGNVSTVAFVVGAAALTGTAVLWLAGSAVDTNRPGLALLPAVGAGEAGLLLRGSW